MAKKGRNQPRSDETKPSIPLEDAKADAENEGESRDPSKEETTEIKKVPPPPVILNERQFPIASFARGKGALGGAFLSEHNIKNKGRTVKRTRAEWDVLYAEFLKAPRG